MENKTGNTILMRGFKKSDLTKTGLKRFLNLKSKTTINGNLTADHLFFIMSELSKRIKKWPGALLSVLRFN
ncbi:MAG: hypothetical protein ABIK53_03510 [bacterium]